MFGTEDLFFELQQIILGVSKFNSDTVWVDQCETLVDKLTRLMTDNIRVWVVGKITDYPAWELQGVFTSEKLADAACTDGCFIGPACLNEKLPDMSVEWPMAYYPIRLTPVVGDAAVSGNDGEQTRTSGQAGEGSAPHPPRA